MSYFKGLSRWAREWVHHFEEDPFERENSASTVLLCCLK
jgi:hypothetical protein